MFKGYLYIISFVVLISACDPCDDCNSIAFEPTMELVFINADSLELINEELVVINSNISSITEELEDIDSILNHLNNRIIELNEREANGEDVTSEKQQASDSVIQFDEIRATVQQEFDQQDDARLTLLEISEVINSGNVFVSQVEIIETGATISYQDSATSFNIPLSLDESFFNYAVTIAEETYTFEVDYELFQEVDADRNVLTRAEDIRIVDHSFDDLEACTENCVDGEATFTFFF